MSKDVRAWLFIIAASFVSSAYGSGDDDGFTAGMDTLVRPGDDFYAYANGRWLAGIHIPADHTGVGTLQTAIDGMDVRMRSLLDAAATAPSASPAGKLSAYYRAYLDAPARDKRGLSPLRPLIDEVDQAPDRHALASLMGREEVDFTASLVDIYVDVDHFDGHRYAAFLSQAGLIMPERDHYLDKRFGAQRLALKDYLADLFHAAGAANPTRSASDVVAFEIAVARLSWSDDRQVASAERRLDRAALRRMAPGMDWAALLDAAGVPDDVPVIVSEPGATKALAALYARTPMPVLREWMLAHALDRAAPFLDSEMVSLWQRFHGEVLAGRTSALPAWQVAVRTVAGMQCVGEGGPTADCFGSLRWAAGDLYLAAYFPDNVRHRAASMIDDLRAAFRKRLGAEAWMSAGTRVEALRKLDAYTVKLGGPERPASLDRVAISPDDVVGDARAAATWEWARQRDRLGQRVDPTAWIEAPQTVDANNGQALDVEFPAGLLQMPVFDAGRDDAYNFGAMGAFIGHEWTHAFDDEGRHIDAQNRRRDWWTAGDEKAFRRRAASLARQYDDFEPLPGEHVSGQQTLSEDMADLGGLSVALDAYHASLHGQVAPVVDGLTGDQRVFLSWAWLWRGKSTAEALRQQLVDDVHAPFAARVEGVLRNMDAWYDAFGIREGNRLYLAPSCRVRIW